MLIVKRILLSCWMCLLLFLPSSIVKADTTLPSSSAFSMSSPSTFSMSSFNFDDYGNVKEPPHPLYVPTKTPTPNEGFRWNQKRIYVYMDTDEPSIRHAFKVAVKAWNRVHVICLVWTTHESRANIVAQSGSLSDNTSNTNNSVGYSTTSLGSTETNYDPDNHVLLHATSTLDAAQLAPTTQTFKDHVAEHELGHAIGLAHAPDWQHSVMVSKNVRTGITKQDYKSVKEMYK